MTKLDARSHRRMPWKNGGGTTTEVARSPEGAADEFDWRVSIARVERPGPFSRFSGVDRTIAVLEGRAMSLHVSGRGAVVLDDRSLPFAFPGDVDAEATLGAGPVEDINVMTRRGRYRHFVTRVHLDAPARVPTLGDLTLLVVTRGAATARHDTRTETLGPRDALRLDTGSEVLVEPTPTIELVVVDLWRMT